MLAFHGFALLKSATRTAVAATATRCPIERIAAGHASWLAASAASPASRAVEIQALNTECPATSSTTTSRPAKNQQTLRLRPRPYKDSGFNNAGKSGSQHRIFLQARCYEEIATFLVFRSRRRAHREGQDA